jgi:ectoine hydroxylase-related dioxygenase (phytanoyl-CoA dioxygenase family)
MSAAGAASWLDEPFAVDDELVAAYRRDGHVCVRGLAPHDELAPYRTAVERCVDERTTEVDDLADRDTYGKAFLQVMNLWEHDDDVRRLVLARRFAGVAAALMGVDAVRLYHDQALVKEGGGGYTPWHQDQNYWPLATDHTVTMWLALVDIATEVGSMSFASGSHRDRDVGAGHISDASHDAVAAHLAERGHPVITHGAMRAGDATFHGGWTLHTAPANPTDVRRTVMTVIYVADGTRIAEPTDQQRFDLLLWLGGRSPGDLVDSHKNPLLGGRAET